MAFATSETAKWNLQSEFCNTCWKLGSANLGSETTEKVSKDTARILSGRLEILQNNFKEKWKTWKRNTGEKRKTSPFLKLFSKMVFEMTDFWNHSSTNTYKKGNASRKNKNSQAHHKEDKK